MNKARINPNNHRVQQFCRFSSFIFYTIR